MTNFNQKVWELTKKIPKGRVSTYGKISSKLKGEGNLKVNPRMVGWALHANKSLDVPCHRVVNREGRLAPNFAFDGWQEQRRRLLAEGVKFTDEMYVDLEKSLWQA